MRTSSFLAVMLAIVCGAAMALGDDAPNLLRNANFAVAANGTPESWTTSGDPATVTQQLSVVQDADGPYLRLACARCDPRTPSSHAMLAQANVPLQKGRTYEFSAQIRASGIRGGVVSVAIRNTRDWSECGLTAEIAVSDRWTPCRKVFKATQDTADNNRLQVWFTEPGMLELRDLRVSAHTAQAARFTNTTPAGISRNLVCNGSLENGSAGWSSVGANTGWGNLASLHGTIEQGGAADGSSFLRIALGPGMAPELAFDYYQPIFRQELSPLAANLGWIAVEPGKPYTLSCQLRASEAGVPAIVGISEQDPTGSLRQQRRKVNLTAAWSQYGFTFRPQARYAYVTIGPDLAEQRSCHVDVDSVQLEQAEAATAYVAHTPVELALTTPTSGGITYVGDSAEVLVHITNSLDAVSEVVVQLDAKDFYGQTLQLPGLKLAASPKTTVVGRVTIPADWRGYYEITASAAGVDGPAHVRLAIVPKRELRDTVCGINHAFAAGELIGLADGAGVSWYRDWSLKWQHIEPKPGEWHWDVSDQQIGRVLKQNERVLPLLPPFPSAEWNSEAPANLASSGYPGVRLRQAWAPREAKQLADFIAAAVGRYKDRINVWEFLNEPIHTDYALPADSANKYGGRKYGPADYVNLLTVASKAMKGADPKCRVIGGLAGGPRQMTRELIDAGILQQIDILNVHMYPGLRAPEAFAADMDELLAMMDGRGGRKPIWITEFSYYGTDRLPREPFVPVPSSWAENRLLADERQCADYTVRYFLIMLSHGVERIFIHSGASGQVNAADLECAIFDYGGAPRKLYPALAMLTSVLGASPRSAGSDRIGDDGWCAAFETGKQSIVAVWSTRETPAKLPPKSELAWVDVVGRKLATAPAQLSTSPVYLIAPSGQAAKLLAEITGRP